MPVRRWSTRENHEPRGFQQVLQTGSGCRESMAGRVFTTSSNQVCSGKDSFVPTSKSVDQSTNGTTNLDINARTTRWIKITNSWLLFFQLFQRSRMILWEIAKEIDLNLNGCTVRDTIEKFGKDISSVETCSMILSESGIHFDLRTNKIHENACLYS